MTSPETSEEIEMGIMTDALKPVFVGTRDAMLFLTGHPLIPIVILTAGALALIGMRIHGDG